MHPHVKGLPGEFLETSYQCWVPRGYSQQYKPLLWRWLHSVLADPGARDEMARPTLCQISAQHHCLLPVLCKGTWSGGIYLGGLGGAAEWLTVGPGSPWCPAEGRGTGLESGGHKCTHWSLTGHGGLMEEVVSEQQPTLCALTKSSSYQLLFLTWSRKSW